MQVEILISVKEHKSRDEGKWRPYGNRNLTKTKFPFDDIHDLKSFKTRKQASGWEYSILLMLK